MTLDKVSKLVKNLTSEITKETLEPVYANVKVEHKAVHIYITFNEKSLEETQEKRHE